jgi:hypothetical protein
VSGSSGSSSTTTSAAARRAVSGSSAATTATASPQWRISGLGEHRLVGDLLALVAVTRDVGERQHGVDAVQRQRG